MSRDAQIEPEQTHYPTLCLPDMPGVVSFVDSLEGSDGFDDSEGTEGSDGLSGFITPPDPAPALGARADHRPMVKKSTATVQNAAMRTGVFFQREELRKELRGRRMGAGGGELAASASPGKSS
jgi:hypothetical protein